MDSPKRRIVRSGESSEPSEEVNQERVSAIDSSFLARREEGVKTVTQRHSVPADGESGSEDRVEAEIEPPVSVVDVPDVDTAEAPNGVENVGDSAADFEDLWAYLPEVSEPRFGVSTLEEFKPWPRKPGEDDDEPLRDRLGRTRMEWMADRETGDLTVREGRMPSDPRDPNEPEPSLSDPVWVATHVALSVSEPVATQSVGVAEVVEPELTPVVEVVPEPVVEVVPEPVVETPEPVVEVVPEPVVETPEPVIEPEPTTANVLDYADAEVDRSQVVVLEKEEKNPSRKKQGKKLAKGGMYFKARDALILQMIATFGWLSKQEIAGLLEVEGDGVADRTLRYGLANLKKFDMIAVSSGARGEHMYSLTNFGAKKARIQGYTPASPTPSALDHTSALAAAYILLKSKYPKSVIMSERDVAASAKSGVLAPHILAAAPGMSRLHDFESWRPTYEDSGSLKRPDLLIFLGGDDGVKPRPVEVELSLKKPKDYKRIIRAYETAADLDNLAKTLIYITGDGTGCEAPLFRNFYEYLTEESLEENKHLHAPEQGNPYVLNRTDDDFHVDLFNLRDLWEPFLWIAASED